MPKLINGDYSQIKHLLERDNINIMLANSPVTNNGNVLVAICCVYIFPALIPFNELMYWLLYTFLIALLRIKLRQHYLKRNIETPEDVKKWRAIFITASFLAGSSWAYASWFFVLPEYPLYMAFMAGTLMAIAAASIGSNGGFFLSFISFSIPSLLLLTLKFFLMDNELSNISTFFMLALTVGFIFFAHGYQKSIFETLGLKYQNKELLDKLESNNIELSYQMKLAQEANRQKSHFLAAASHDLRQPLQSLTLFSDILKFQVQSADAKLTLQKIEQSIQALSSLFNALLDISQLEAGAIKPHKQHVDLNKLFNELHNSFYEQAKVEGIELSIDANNMFVFTDPQLLKRCISNLIINAVKHSKGNKILISASYLQEKIEVKVTDNGQGIPLNEHQNIFIEFHQLNNPERERRKGLGLGLAIVKQTCELLSHEITINSSVDNGCKFSITLEEGKDNTFLSFKPPIIQRNLSGKKILIIDDEKDIREAMEILFNRWDMQVETAASEDDVKTLINNNYQPDVIVSDYRLPDNKTGSMMVQLLRQAGGYKIPAILVTGDTASDRIKEARKSNLPVLHKPIQPARLKIALTKIMSGK